jgi:hypothetical protein
MNRNRRRALSNISLIMKLARRTNYSGNLKVQSVFIAFCECGVRLQKHCKHNSKTKKWENEDDGGKINCPKDNINPPPPPINHILRLILLDLLGAEFVII